MLTGLWTHAGLRLTCRAVKPHKTFHYTAPVFPALPAILHKLLPFFAPTLMSHEFCLPWLFLISRPSAQLAPLHEAS